MKTVNRFGKSVPADEAFEAWSGGDINRMLAAVDTKTNGVDRHHLLSSIVVLFFQARSRTKGSSFKLRTYAQLHLRELPFLLSELERDWREGRTARGTETGAEYVMPEVPTFDCLCMLLCEQGEFDQARAVWRQAAQMGYIAEDGLGYWDALIEKRRKRFAKSPPVVL